MPRTTPPRKDKNRVPRNKRALPPASTKDAERVAKVIARAGLGSRREIEDWILDGRVAVNGLVLTSPAFTVTAEDAIVVDGEPLPERERTRLFLYHKPKGVVTTNRDPEGRTTLFEILPKGLPRLVSVGRLDLNSEGLLLLTNDGGLARALELPETGWLRRYRVRAKGEINQAQLDRLIAGTTVDGIEYGPIEAVLDRVQGANAWITMSLREGKNREVRNVLAGLGMQVNRLIRVSYGPFQLGEIPEGEIEEVRTRILRDQIGDEIAAASGADFDGPLIEHEIEPAPSRAAHWAEDGEAPQRTPRAGATRRGPPRGAEPEPESRGRARHPAGAVEDTAAFRVRSRRADPEREVESRGTVSDRKGREIKVERVVNPPQEETRPQQRRGYDGKDSGGRDTGGRDTGGKRFGKGAAPDRSGGKSFGAKPRPAREGDGYAPRSDRPDKRPAGGAGYAGARPPRSGDDRPRKPHQSDRPARARDEEGTPRHDRPWSEARPDRDEAPRARAPRDRDERPRTDSRPPRRDDRAGGFRSERPGSDARPPRDRDERPRTDSRPPRRDDRAGGFRSERPGSDARPPRDRDERPRTDSRPPRRDDRAGGFRSERPGSDARPPRDRDERPRTDSRPPRRDDRAGGFRSERPGSDARPPRDRDERPRTDSRPPRRDDRPRDDRPREDRPRSDRPHDERPRTGAPASVRFARPGAPKAGPRTGYDRRNDERRGDDVGFAERKPRAPGGKPGGFKAGGARSDGPQGERRGPPGGGFKGGAGKGPRTGGPKSGAPRGKPPGPRGRS